MLDVLIQKCIESGSKYDFVMNCIIIYIEQHNCKIIGIYYTSGHHRSVALVELIKKHIYLNSNIKHLDINK
jgi:RNase adaptor protein for sRNA GlmZ degradation